MTSREEIDWKLVQHTFIQKAQIKNIDPHNLSDMFSQRNYELLRVHWHKSLGNHFSKENLPDSAVVFEYLKEIISSKILI